MDSTLKGILSLLGGKDAEARSAALLVLTHLGVTEDRVVSAVGDALKSPNVVIRDLAVGYFEKTRPKEGVSLLVPLLDAHEDSLRQRIVAILAEYGGPAVAATRKLLDGAPRRRQYAIIELCARVRSPAALDILFEFMAGDDFEVNKAACDALIAAMPGMSPKERADVHQRADQLAAKAKGQRTALVASAKLFGALAESKARKRLFAMLDGEPLPVVRSHALHALVNCLRGEKLTDAEIEKLWPIFNEEDEASFLRPVVRLLEDQELGKRYLGRLNKLAESPQPLVRRFAVAKLGRFESGAVVKTLIGYLSDESFARRSQAEASLKTLPAARNALMKELLDCNDPHLAWTLADILLLHDRSWKRDTIEALWNKLEKSLDTREDRLFAAYYHFLQQLDADDLYARLKARAERLRRNKKFAAAAKTLALFKDTVAFDDESRYAFALSELQAHAHTLASVARRQDPALDTLRTLSRSAFPLAERLRKERALTAEDIYYVAFNFAEGRSEEKAVAAELLEYIANKYGRTKVGKAARNKLQLLGPAVVNE